MDNANLQPYKDSISDREVEVLRLLAEGLTNREIGERLYLSLETIKWYNKQIYQKLGVSNRSQAAARARQLGLLSGAETKPVPGEAQAFNLPSSFTSFVGRQRETAELLALLQESRLVTITGPGGSGKTRLAIHVAGKAAVRFPNGMVFISLAATRDTAQVAGTIAQEVGVTESAGRQLVESLQGYLANKELLLILDNFEHLLPAAPLVTSLLAAAPRLTVLTTSRELLHLTAEREYPLYPLPLPAEGQTTAANLEEVAATALFNQRAKAASPGYTLSDENASSVATICRRLDGLPLAIELAAAWIRLFTPQQLLERLDSRLALLKGGPQDAPDRQRALRNTLDWSYQLLDPDEQIFFNRLAVFVGGRTMEAIEAICKPDLEPDTLSVVSALFDKSLVYQEQGPDNQPRFIMLETIHEYAWERLIASGEEHEIRDRHLAYFLELAEKMGAGYHWHNQLLLLEQTSVEMNNLRAAFSWALESGKYEAAARMATALDYFLFYRANPVEGVKWFERALSHVATMPTHKQSRFYIGAANLAWVTDNLDQARNYFQRSLTISRKNGDLEEEALSLLGLSIAGIDFEPYDTAVARIEEALDILRRINYLPGIAQGLTDLGELARLNGDTHAARQAYEDSLAVSRKTGEIYRTTLTLCNLSMTAYDEGDYIQAMGYSREAVQRWVEINARQSTASELAMLAGPLARLGYPVEAATLLGAGTALLKDMGAGVHPSDMSQIEKYTAYVKQVLGEDAFAKAWTEGSKMSLSEAISYALKPDPTNY